MFDLVRLYLSLHCKRRSSSIRDLHNSRGKFRPRTYSMESQLASKTATTGSFSSVQKEYLQSLFSGLAERGLVPFAGHTASGQIINDASAGAPNMAAEELYFNTPVSDLCREERWKYEQNPLDIWEKLLAHANEDKAPAQDDLFRFKFHGLFHVAPAQDSFMLRLRIPGSVLTDYQMRGLAKLAAEYGPCRVDLTTRGNLQIRSLQPKNIVCVLNAIQAIGMSSRGSGADNIRNITASPISGIDPAELYDVAPLAEEWAITSSIRAICTVCRGSSTLHSIMAARSACLPIPTTSGLSPCALQIARAFRPESIFVCCSVASQGTNSSRPTAACCFALTRPSQWLLPWVAASLEMEIAQIARRRG